MKRLLTILITIALFACGTSTSTQPNTEVSDPSVRVQDDIALPSMDLLLGKWKRTNDPEGSSTYESWKKISENEYRGHGYTLSEKDTVFQEHICLMNEPKGWIFEVSGPNDMPTPFVLSSLSEKGFTAENSANDFPKKIVYTYGSGTMMATISGGGPSIEFHFEAIPQ